MARDELSAWSWPAPLARARSSGQGNEDLCHGLTSAPQLGFTPGLPHISYLVADAAFAASGAGFLQGCLHPMLVPSPLCRLPSPQPLTLPPSPPPPVS